MNRLWTAWVDRVTGGDSARHIAKRLGLSHTTVLRWLNDGVPAEAALRIAIAYRADPIVGLIAAGCISESDAEELTFEETLQSLPTWVLTAELHRRAELLRA